MFSRPTITIMGAGIGGLAAALALHQAGFECAVYEQAPRIEAVGAGQTQWPNAFKALREGLVALSPEAIMERQFNQITEWQL